MAHSTYVRMYGPSADHTSITTVLYYCMLLLYYTSITTVLQQYITRILRGGTKTVEEEQFSATKWSQGELIHSLFWFQREYLGGEEWYDSTPHAAFLLLSARMATLSFLVTLAAKPVSLTKRQHVHLPYIALNNSLPHFSHSTRCIQAHTHAHTHTFSSE